MRGDDQITAILAIIAQVDPDIILLTDFDYDLDQVALGAFAQKAAFPFHFSLPPNAGIATGLDLDGNGYLGDARDAQGYGRFKGDGGMAILSKLAINESGVQDYSPMRWRDLAGATLPSVSGAPFPSAQAQEIQRLSSNGHWIVPFQPEGMAPFSLLAFDATPPVFDGPEDMNGLRNRDELRLISYMIDQIEGPFIVAGNSNLDPSDGDGMSAAMDAFLSRADLLDPFPSSLGGMVAADPAHIGDPRYDTVDWPSDGPGNLRVSYVLPSVEWAVSDAGVTWPAPDDPAAALLGEDGLLAGAHRLVWVDIQH